MTRNRRRKLPATSNRRPNAQQLLLEKVDSCDHQIRPDSNNTQKRQASAHIKNENTSSTRITQAPEQTAHGAKLAKYRKFQDSANARRVHQSILVLNNAQQPSISSSFRSLEASDVDQTNAVTPHSSYYPWQVLGRQGMHNKP